MRYEFWAGSYGTAEEETIARFSLDAETGQITKLYGFRGAENPSWIGMNAAKTMLYSVEELTPEGRILAFRIGEQGLEPAAGLSTKGADPCHICLDEKEKHLFAANYTSGSLAVYRLNQGGAPVQMTEFLRYTGSGSDPVRQEGPHIHFTEVMGEQVFAVDLGTDTVFVYLLDAAAGTLTDMGKGLRLPAGAGPRHLAFHPEIPGIVYVACELGSSVALFREKGGEYVLEAAVSTLPESYSGENTVAAIRIRKDCLFVSNRGHDSIAVFSIQEDGSLSLQQIVPAGGRIPRDFAIMGEYVVIANQGSDEITVLRMNPETGLLEQTGICASMLRPACICPVSSR